MKRFWKVGLLLSLAVFLGMYGFLLSGGREPLRLETISGDSAALAPYEISFSLIEPQCVEQRYTLRDGTLTQKNCFLEEGTEWKVPVVRQRSEQLWIDISYAYTCWRVGSDRSYLVVKKAWQGDSEEVYLPGIYPKTIYDRPIIAFGIGDTVEGFWEQDGGFFCVVQSGKQAELRQYSEKWELVARCPFDSVQAGFFQPAHRSTHALSFSPTPGRWMEYEEAVRRMRSEYPPDPDGAQIFQLDGGKLLVIGAWRKAKSSGVDLYLFEPGKLLYHGRIATNVWLDYELGGIDTITQLGESYSDLKLPIRYFALPEVITAEDGRKEGAA